MSKQPKKPKRLPKPAPCECWCILQTDGRIYPGWCGDRRTIREWKHDRVPGDRVIRVRIVPVAKAKRRKGGGK